MALIDSNAVLPKPLSGQENDLELLNQLALHQIFYALPSHLLRVLVFFGSASAVFQQCSKRPLNELGIPKGVADQLCLNHKQHLSTAKQALKWVRLENHCLLGLGDPEYPPLLKEIADPPVFLFADGDFTTLKDIKFAVVGSRHPTRSGIKTARDLSFELARLGVTIVSGMAKGIDSEAHKGALAAGRKTLAVLGTGCDLVYPPGQGRLANQIKEKGLLVSEFPPGTPARRQNFPQRNRIVTGLSLGTLIVEAADKSGSLISARLAMEQGREVFAVPGSIYSRQSRGCHSLLRDGAKLTESVSDIIEELQGLVQFELAQHNGTNREIIHLNDLEKRLVAEMDLDPTQFDELMIKTNLPVNQLSSLLTGLEIKGIVQSDIMGYSLAPGKKLKPGLKQSSLLM